MKSLLIICLTSSSLLCAAQSQLEHLRQLNGSWVPDKTQLDKGMAETLPPDFTVSCETASQVNGVYCEVTASINGSRTVLSTELLAYNQADDKIYLMLFEGPSVVYGSGKFEGDTFIYTDTDVSGNKIQDGRITINQNTLVQQVTRLDNGTEITMDMTFKKK